MADDTPGPKALPKKDEPSESMLRCPFDPAQRRGEMFARLVELRVLIPQMEEEKARIEGAITLLDEIVPVGG